MADVSFKSATVGNPDPGNLAGAFQGVGQPAKPTADGVLLSPRDPVTPLLQWHDLAARGFNPDEFTAAFRRIDPRINPERRLQPLGRQRARDAVDQWLDRGDFGQIAAKLLETSPPDERHLWLREIVLPRFFEVHPEGRLGCVTYAEFVNRYLALLNLLQRSNVLDTADPAAIKKYLAHDSMSSFQLNVPAEMVWLMLGFGTLAFFPESYSFVASCEHLYFVVFITGRPVHVGQEEERYSPMQRLVPKTLNVLDSRPRGTPFSSRP